MKTIMVVLVSALVLQAPAQAADLFPSRIETFEYPRLGTLARIYGDVELELTVNAAGEVTHTDVTSGHPLLAASAVAGIGKWKFQTACKADSPGESKMRLRVAFRLEGITETRPQTKMTYQFPDQITITSEAPHYQPTQSTAR